VGKGKVGRGRNQRSFHESAEFGTTGVVTRKRQQIADVTAEGGIKKEGKVEISLGKKPELVLKLKQKVEKRHQYFLKQSAEKLL